MTRTPRVAVIVPCFNDGALIEETLESIRDPEPVETVVVDDASTDEATRQVLEQIRGKGIRVERHDVNRGLSAARMSGVAATTAPYVFPLDADDLLMPGALRRMAEALEADARAAVCLGDYMEFGTVERTFHVPRTLDPYRLAYRNEYPVSSLFRRSALIAAGGWRDVDGRVGYEDWHLWMSLAERGERAVHFGGVAYRRRLHHGRMLASAGREHGELYAALKRLHPSLFANLPRHRGASNLSAARKVAYPLLYGSRAPTGLGAAARRTRQRLRRRQDDSVPAP